MPNWKMNEHGTLENLKKAILAYYPDANIPLLEKAHAFASKAHEGQKRTSGDPYIIHPTEVAITLAHMQLDLASIITGLLHDTVEDTGATLETVEKEFGKDVAELVDGVTKLSKMTFKTTEEKQAENFRKMLLAMAKDIRVILVKLADRLNNMRTLEFLSPEKQIRISQETLDIYAPLANRLGISWIKIELEDLCLKFQHPDVFSKLSERVDLSKSARNKFVEGFIELIDEKLKEYEINAQILGRAKHFYSIFKKMERRKLDYDQIHDIIEFRIIVDNITECYKSLGVIHAALKPIPGRFKDYIAMPKANNYQSLHTTVIGPEGDRIEIQIRTTEMNNVAEGGIAAHWKYKEGRFDTRSRDNVEWVHRLLEWHKDVSDPNEFLETVKIDLFEEDVFIFTPNGEVKELTHGSTPLDFAYAVHTDVGNKCVGAKVNGKIVPLKYRLKSGDTVEVITSPTQQPSKDWLKIVKSSRAKSKIRAVIKQQERDKAGEIGGEILEKSLRSFNLSYKQLERSGDLLKGAQAFSIRSIDDLLITVGYGKLQPEKFIEQFLPKEEIQKIIDARKLADEEELLQKNTNQSPKKEKDTKNIITIGSHGDILTRFGKCCSPLPGDSIIGFITRGRGVTVHTANCSKALDNDEERRVDVEWNKASLGAGKRLVRIKILCHDEKGLLATMTQTMTTSNVNITSANIRTTKDKKAIAIFEIEVSDISQLQRTMSALESKKGVIAVERVKN